MRADVLLQMGAVRLCQDEVSEARALLEESIGHAKRLALPVTQAFARSALGAVEYHDGRFGHAQQQLTLADDIFRKREHQEGLALNARRLVVLARRVLEVGESRTPESVAEMAQVARHRYEVLKSPAGIAACEVEGGRVGLFTRRFPKTIVERLVKLLDDTPQRSLLELDPWVPRVLDDFAQESGDEGLARRTRRLAQTGRRRLAELRDEALAVAGLGTAAAMLKAPVTIDEMGGETRHAREALVPASAA